MNLRSSLIWSYATQYGMTAIQFASSIILARLLLPEEIGIFSVAISFVAFGHMLRDFGIGEYLIQEKNLTDEKIRTGFTLALLLSWSLALLLYLLSKPIADFYNQPGLLDIFPLIVFNFLIIPFGSITIALLRKEMRFDLIARINLTSSLVQPVVSITLAYLGFSYMSLAWATVAGTFTSVMMTLLYRNTKPTFSLSLSNWKDFFHYGSHNTITNLASTVTSSAPDLIIGKLLNMHLVGIFNRGQGLLQNIRNIALGGIKPILLPHFSKKLSHGDDALSQSLKDITNYFLFIFWPLLLFISSYSREIILFLFGENWIEASPVLSYLCFGAIFGVITAFYPEIFKATGNIKYLSRITLSFSIIRVAVLLIGSTINFHAMVALYSTISFFYSAYTIHALKHHTKLNLEWIYGSIIKNGIVALIIVAPCYLLKETAHIFDVNVLLLFGFTIFALLWIIALVLFYKPILRFVTH